MSLQSSIPAFSLCAAVKGEPPITCVQLESDIACIGQSYGTPSRHDAIADVQDSRVLSALKGLSTLSSADL